MRHPGAGRDPVGIPCQPVSFSIITQVCFRKQDTARPRYDDSALFLRGGARYGGMTEQCAISLPWGPIPRYDDSAGNVELLEIVLFFDFHRVQ